MTTRARVRLGPASLGAALAIVLAACGGAPSPGPTAATGSPEGGSPASGPGVSAPPGAPLLVAIQASADDPGAGETAAGFVDRAAALGGTARILDAGHDPRRTVLLVGEAIAAGARGIAVDAPDAAVGPAVARLATEAGVALVATGARIDAGGGAPVPFVGFDDGRLGAAAGDAAARLLATSGWEARRVGVLALAVPGVAACAARTGAAQARLVAAGVLPSNILAVPYSGQVASARDAALPVVAGNPQLARWVAVGCDDAGVAGALGALAAANVGPDDAIGVGIGADLACRAWAVGAPTGFRASLLVADGEVGANAAALLWNAAVRGVALPAETLVPGTLVTRETYRALLPPALLDACGSFPTPPGG